MKEPIVVLRLMVAAGLLIFASGCMARQKSWDANVRLLPEGSVCFSIEDQTLFGSDVVRVAAIVVSELDQREQVLETVWTGDFTQATPPAMLSAKTCMPYGSHSAGRTVGPAIPVEPGHRYSVFINADIKDGDDWSNRGYGAYFCVTEDVIHRPVVHEIRWDDAMGLRRWEVCELPGR